jgi:opacity protein-like surface antigen
MKALFIILLGMTCINAAHAETGIKASNRQMSLSIGRQHINYTEQDNYAVTSNGVLDSEKGTLTAYKVDYTLQGDGLGINDLYGSLSYAYAKGKTKYDGYIQSFATGAITPYQTETHTSTDDFQLKVGKGYGFFANKTLQLTPYVSYSYRQWQRDTSRDPYGYLEVYDHNALALGLLAQVAITQNLVASFDASEGKTFSSKMQVEHYDEFKLRSRPIRTYGVGLDYAFASNWHAVGSYQYTEFRYGESPVVNGFIEPDSKTKLSKIYIGAGYGF